ncbi:SymE family type I addiction module toxin [Flagellimonas algicola]|uniref:Type I toxin-antitoxin system SymE family toxin n=1 Tax=Flagellimonas algicola TaxID=2583815 RepID=A0ABY2WJF2_9FLAO|nr:SymE family type I addiction module toxin [Allomuricauda algicola]TMU54970.1 type I toxin-antitoxin system SymE family toxin [Allomuricauda algicola]
MKKIKIQPKHRKRTYDEIIIPEIRMEGKWLEALGFRLGEYVQVEWVQDKLVITPIKDEKKSSP